MSENEGNNSRRRTSMSSEDRRESLGEFLSIDEELFDDFLSQTGRSRAPEPEPIVVEDDEEIVLDDDIILNGVRVLDGVESTRRLRDDLSGMDPSSASHVYVNDRSLNQGNVSRLEFVTKHIEKELNESVPEKLSTMEKTVVTMEDVVKIYKDQELDKVNYFYSPVEEGNLVLIKINRKGAVLFSVDDTKVSSMSYDKKYVEFIQEITDSISFHSIIVGMLKEETLGMKMVLMDCLNYNGKFIGKEPYFTRYQRLHELSGLLYSDNFTMLSFRFDDVDEFLDDMKKTKQPFFIVDTNHVSNNDDDFLITTAMFVDDNEKIHPKEIIIGKEIAEKRERMKRIKESTITIVDSPVEKMKESTGSTDQSEKKGIEGMRIYITGTVPDIKKDEMKRIVEANGGIWHSRVNGRLDLLVIADRPGSGRMEDARELKIKTMNYKDFFKLLNN